MYFELFGMIIRRGGCGQDLFELFISQYGNRLGSRARIDSKKIHEIHFLYHAFQLASAATFVIISQYGCVDPRADVRGQIAIGISSASRSSVNDSSGEAASMDMMATGLFHGSTGRAVNTVPGSRDGIFPLGQIQIRAISQMQHAEEKAHQPVRVNRQCPMERKCQKTRVDSKYDKKPAKQFNTAT